MRKASWLAVFLVAIMALGPVSTAVGGIADTGGDTGDPSPLSCSGSTPHDDDTNYYVDAASGDDSYPGTQACPTQTIQQAVTNAGPDDTVIVNAGTSRRRSHSLGGQSSRPQAARWLSTARRASLEISARRGLLANSTRGGSKAASRTHGSSSCPTRRRCPLGGRTPTSRTSPPSMTTTTGPMARYPGRTSTTPTPMATDSPTPDAQRGRSSTRTGATGTASST